MDEALVKIHDLEHKYGSISQAPLNCEELIHIRYLLGASDKNLRFNEDIDDETDSKIAELYKQGKTYTKIGETIGHSVPYVSRRVMYLISIGRLAKQRGGHIKNGLLSTPAFRNKLIDMFQSNIPYEKIAKEMGIAINTVKAYRTTLRKDGVEIPGERRKMKKE